jgi:hypothetical protein
VHVEITESTPKLPPAVRTPTRSVCVCELAHRACPLARLALAPSALCCGDLALPRSPQARAAGHAGAGPAASTPDAYVADSPR